ncbi:uncharacterized protein LOC131680830 [Topomyia yanbarensis]|uniref:uncharacterized protein LOC131680830 n=1 Tax=Topomyia yanbarensis TaxID=2498891 RepID=UPI00273B11E1|nr:uncharacterized protein LOC131680830 [Topomyia yanbarensis]
MNRQLRYMSTLNHLKPAANPGGGFGDVTSTQSLDEQRFWEIESCWTTSTQSLEETACENHFAASVFRDQTGRFVVTLPKRAEILNQLGYSKEIATRRFRALERRFDANPHLKEAYTGFIDEYHQLNHMREISDSEASAPIAYYLPHHGVEKAESTTTKQRVVFDASCRTDTGISLNQAFMVGPVIQDDLLSIILRCGCIDMSLSPTSKRCFAKYVCTRRITHCNVFFGAAHRLSPFVLSNLRQ